MFFSMVDWLCAGSALEEWRGEREPNRCRSSKEFFQVID